MKNLIIIALFVSALFSCSKENISSQRVVVNPYIFYKYATYYDERTKQFIYIFENRCASGLVIYKNTLYTEFHSNYGNNNVGYYCVLPVVGNKQENVFLGVNLESKADSVAPNKWIKYLNGSYTDYTLLYELNDNEITEKQYDKKRTLAGLNTLIPMAITHYKK